MQTIDIQRFIHTIKTAKPQPHTSLGEEGYIYNLTLSEWQNNILFVADMLSLSLPAKDFDKETFLKDCNKG